MPSSIASVDSSLDPYDSDEEDRIAQEEWEQSIQDLQKLVSAILLPYVGKYFGRSFSYWGRLSTIYLHSHLISPQHLADISVSGWANHSFGVGCN